VQLKWKPNRGVQKKTVPYGTQKSRGLKHGMTLKTDVPDLTDQFFGISHNIRLCIFWASPSHGMAWWQKRNRIWEHVKSSTESIWVYLWWGDAFFE